MLAAVELDLCERSGVALDWLGDAAFARVELHGALDLERARVRAVSGNADERHPLVVGRNAVVDDLRADEGCMAVEDLLRWGGAIGDCPVVDGRLGDHADSRVGYPFPEHNVLVANMRLDLLLRLDVENLQCALRYTNAIVFSHSFGKPLASKEISIHFKARIFL